MPQHRPSPGELWTSSILIDLFQDSPIFVLIDLHRSEILYDICSTFFDYHLKLRCLMWGGTDKLQVWYDCSTVPRPLQLLHVRMYANDDIIDSAVCAL